MTRPRTQPNLTTKLASALLALGDVPYDDAKQMSAAQIISLYQFDHGILHAFDGPDAFWNLTPRLIVPHRRKSGKDKGIVSKVDRLTDEQTEFRRRVLARPCGAKRERTNKIPGRVNPWPKRKVGRK